MGSRAGDTRLRRRDRVRDRKDYVRLQRDSRRRSSRHFTLLVGRTHPAAGASTDGGARLGLTVSRRVGDAVRRNRVKRRIREVFRQSRGALPCGVDLVVVARPGAAQLSAAATREELQDLLATGGRS